MSKYRIPRATDTPPVKPSLTTARPAPLLVGGWLASLLLVAALAYGVGQGGCKLDWPSAPAKVTAVTFVYEKSDHDVPSGVLAGLDKLNKRGIVATDIDQDVVDGDNQVPAQYKFAIPAAQSAGLPALVVQAGERVTKVVKNPRTEAHVLEAVP